MPKEVDVQALYKENGEQLFEQLYRNERQAFVKWSIRAFGCSVEDSLEVFQQSMVVFYEKVDRGQLTTITSSLKTYLFAIGRNLMLKRFRKRERLTLPGTDFPELVVESLAMEEEISEEERRLQIAIVKLQEGCRKLLDLFFYHNFGIQEIADEMNYNTLDVVRTKKYKCLRQLKKLMQPNPSPDA